MKANAPKRKIFNDAVDVLYGDDIPVPINGIEMLSIDSVHPFRKLDLCQYFGQKKLKDYATFLSSISSFCYGVI